MVQYHNDKKILCFKNKSETTSINAIPISVRDLKLTHHEQDRVLPMNKTSGVARTKKVGAEQFFFAGEQ